MLGTELCPANITIDAIAAPESILRCHAIIAHIDPHYHRHYIDYKPQEPLVAIRHDHQHLCHDGNDSSELIHIRRRIIRKTR